MNIPEAIKQRRSVRSYLSKSISKRIIEELIGLANLAPTAANTENRRFIVITNPETKLKLFDAGCKQPYLQEAPVIVAVAADTTKFKPKEFLELNKIWQMDLSQNFNRNFEIWKTLWPIQDVDTAVTTLLLAAKEKGLDTCWIGTFDFEKVNEVLSIPPNFRVTVLITLGYMKNPPYPQKRKNPNELIHWEKW